MNKIFLLGGLFLTLFSFNNVSAQTAYEAVQDIVAAEVVEVVSERQELITGTDAIATVQTLRARLYEGEHSGDIVLFESDLFTLSAGDKIYVTHIRDINGTDIYVLKDVDRGFGLLILFLIFVAALLIFSGRQGVRALFSLAVSLAGIVFVLLPALLAGYDPMLMSLLISAVILAVALFGTHGFGPVPTIAYLGTVSAVLLTTILAWFFVGFLRLSGYGDDVTVYLNFATRGELDLAGLLLGSIVIGVLGVLDDICVTQVSVVGELKKANPKLSALELYSSAVKVGRDHISSLVNTLALAYVGAALPLVLLFSTSTAPLYFTLNQEVISAEMVRILIGSIGLIMAVPLTSIVAAWWFSKKGVDSIDLEHYHHHHNH